MKFKADDCSPFYKESEVITDYKEQTLLDFVASVDNISIYGERSALYDSESKIAYDPLDVSPWHFEDGPKRVWQAGRYIGTAKIGKSIVEIKPRFGEEWLYYLADDLFHFRKVDSKTKANDGSWNKLFRRLFWHIWLRKFAEADKYGLPRHTTDHTNQGMQIRGRLNVHKSFLPLYRKGEVVSQYREKTLDDSICRIIYRAYGILVEEQLSDVGIPPTIKDSINALYNHYHDQIIQITEHDYQSIRYKSIYMGWKPLVDFSWQIINHKLNDGKRAGKNGFSIFLDVAEIWEAFLRKQIGERLADSGWRVWSMWECKQRIYIDTFFSRDIMPDIVLERDARDGEKEYMIFDAKYKVMEGRSFDVDRADLFQIHTYIQYFTHVLGHVKVAGLLYPLAEKNDKLPTITSLFGINGNQATTFIIDGIVCKDMKTEDDKTYFENSIKELVERIITKCDSSSE